MKFLITLITVLSLGHPVLAHDEGHGPKVTDAPKQGGVLAPIIEAKDSKLGKKAKLVYKAELVRSEDGTARVFLYDDKMNPLLLDGFEKKAGAILETGKTKVKKVPFELTLAEDSFTGKIPTPSSKPFNIDVTYKKGDLSLLSAFDNLD